MLSKGLRERVLRSWRRALHVVALLSLLSPQLAYRSLSIIGDSGGKSNHRDTETCQHDLIKGKLPPIPSGSRFFLLGFRIKKPTAVCALTECCFQNRGEDGRRFLLDKSWTGGNKQITDRHLLKNWQVVVQIALLTKKKAGQTSPIFASIQRFFGIAALC